MRIKFASGKTFVFILLLAVVTVAAPSPNAFALVCGDTIPDAGEECDDGNNASGDGCSAVCTVERDWTQFKCAIDMVDNPANGPFQPGDNMVINSQIPFPEDLVGTGPTDNGNAAVFDSPGQTGVSYLKKDGGQSTGEAEDKVQRIDDGEVDYLAAGGIGSTLKLGDWTMTGFFAEFRDDSGQALTGVEEWPGPDFDYGAFNASQCAADFENADTQETARASGAVAKVNYILYGTTTSPHLSLEVTRGDVAGLIAAVEQANQRPPGSITRINFKGPAVDFVFETGYDGRSLALPPIKRYIEINGAAVFRAGGTAPALSFASVNHGGKLFLRNDSSDLALISNFRSGSSGGAISVFDGWLEINNWTFSGNSSPEGSGGAIEVTGDSRLSISDSSFFNNTADTFGGAIYIRDTSSSSVENTVFSQNEAKEGCDIAAATEPGLPVPWVKVDGTAFTKSECIDFRAYHKNARASIRHSSIEGNTNGAVSGGANTALEYASSLIFDFDDPGQSLSSPLKSAPQPKIKPESLCESEDPDSIVSLGYNIATDGSCNLDQPTDLPNTDPLLSEPDEDGIPSPLPGSPAIDTGPVDVIVFEGDTLATLPCGYRDLKGTARPQDANGDGVFECDRGAVEVPGAGDIVAGHSGAFFNPLRDGEGTYVEILNDNTAVVYTFTYRPDGSGPAWFIGVGKISGNSIIIDELLRPLGTRFGNGFDKDNIDFTPIGGMSMVFPDCKAGANPGNIAYSGEPGLAYEGLITKATRLSNITGCGAETPSAKAGLSGSYFEPARDGEGIIVEWLTSGDVLVVFFTYDQNGNQLWLLGIGTPNGNTVTMDALYASAYTPWGRNFNAADVSIDTWGTFTLTWTACNSVTFEYASTVNGYGSATRNYTRLSSLQGTSCPAFQE